MTPMLLTLTLSAPPAEPIVPALVPTVAVAGAAVVLGTDEIALSKSAMLRLHDATAAAPNRRVNARADRIRRAVSVRVAVYADAVTVSDEMRLFDELNGFDGLPDLGVRVRIDSTAVPSGCLYLWLPAEHFPPPIRQFARP